VRVDRAKAVFAAEYRVDPAALCPEATRLPISILYTRIGFGAFDRTDYEEE
jgi:hypothetical protein